MVISLQLSRSGVVFLTHLRNLQGVRVTQSLAFYEVPQSEIVTIQNDFRSSSVLTRQMANKCQTASSMVEPRLRNFAEVTTSLERVMHDRISGADCCIWFHGAVSAVKVMRMLVAVDERFLFLFRLARSGSNLRKAAC